MSTAYEPPVPLPQRDDLGALPAWLRRPVEAWGVRRSASSWVAGVLGGVAERYRIDPLLARGLFVALCVVSAGMGLLAYAAAWAVLPDAEGRVQYGRLRRGERADAPVAIAVIGGVGAVNLLLGAGFTLLAPAVGGPGALLGLGAVAVLVWWLVTRWDADSQRRVGPAPSARPDRAPGEPAWYARRRTAETQDSPADEHGFRADWIDPVTGSWQETVHSRERRAEAWAATPPGTRGVRGSVPAVGRPAAFGRVRSARSAPAVERRSALGVGAQLLAYGIAALAAAAVLAFNVLAGIQASATLLPVPSIVAALAVLVTAMTLALRHGRRPGSLAPVSGVLVGAAAVRVLVWSFNGW